MERVEGLGAVLEETSPNPNPHNCLGSGSGFLFCRIERNLVQDAVLVIASDGLWDVMCWTQNTALSHPELATCSFAISPVDVDVGDQAVVDDVDDIVGGGGGLIISKHLTMLQVTMLMTCHGPYRHSVIECC